MLKDVNPIITNIPPPNSGNSRIYIYNYYMEYSKVEEEWREWKKNLPGSCVFIASTLFLFKQHVYVGALKSLPKC